MPKPFAGYFKRLAYREASDLIPAWLEAELYDKIEFPDSVKEIRNSNIVRTIQERKSKQEKSPNDKIHEISVAIYNDVRLWDPSYTLEKLVDMNVTHHFNRKFSESRKWWLIVLAKYFVQYEIEDEIAISINYLFSLEKKT